MTPPPGGSGRSWSPQANCTGGTTATWEFRRCACGHCSFRQNMATKHRFTPFHSQVHCARDEISSYLLPSLLQLVPRSFKALSPSWLGPIWEASTHRTTCLCFSRSLCYYRGQEFSRRSAISPSAHCNKINRLPFYNRLQEALRRLVLGQQH